MKELINGFSALSPADPYDAGSIQVIDDGGILLASAVGDLIDAHGLQIPNAVSFSQPSNAAVQLIREGGLSHLQQSGSAALGHELAIDEHRILEPVGNPGIGLGPGDKLLEAAMLAAPNFLGPVVKQNQPATDGNVLPQPIIHRAQDASAALALRTPAPIFIGLDPQMQLPFLEPKLEIDNR